MSNDKNPQHDAIIPTMRGPVMQDLKLYPHQQKAIDALRGLPDEATAYKPDFTKTEMRIVDSILSEDARQRLYKGPSPMLNYFVQQRHADKLRDLFLNGETYLKRSPEGQYRLLYNEFYGGEITSVTADQIALPLTTEHLQKLLEQLDVRVKAASVETVTEQTLQRHKIKLEFDSPRVKLEHFDAVDRRWSFTGFMLVEDERMVEPHISWHDVRSMGRAKRRHARGFRQNLKRIFVPSKSLLVSKHKGAIIGHTQTLRLLKEAAVMQNAREPFFRDYETLLNWRNNLSEGVR